MYRIRRGTKSKRRRQVRLFSELLPHTLFRLMIQRGGASLLFSFTYVLAYLRSFWFGVTYLRGKGGKLQWSLLLRLGLCYVSCTPVRWAPSSLIQLFVVMPYQ